MARRYYACVYGGASEQISNIHKEQIEKLGKIIVQKGFSLVYGAGATGCMGAAARGVKKSGGYVMGISPEFIGEFEEIFACDNTVVVDTMSERKTLMEKHADIFLIAPGCIGTMYEFFQVLTLKYLRRIFTPIVVLNLNGFYNSLFTLIDDLVGQGAIVREIYTLFDVVESINDIKLIKFFDDITFVKG